MNVSPAVTDALWGEYRDDHERGHFPSTIVCPNGSLVCATDYDLCGVLAKEVLNLWPSS